jgi:hypothetical protein
MARQFQLYLLPSDGVRLIEILRQKAGLRLLASRSPESKAPEIETPVHTSAGVTSVDCLLVPGDTSSVKLNRIEKQNQWSVDTLFSEAIQFTGCHFDGRTLKRGRFFYDSGFYQGQEWKEKSQPFLEWAEIIFKTAKKNLTRVASLDAYVGEDARQWHMAGGVLVALSVKNSA